MIITDLVGRKAHVEDRYGDSYPVHLVRGVVVDYGGRVLLLLEGGRGDLQSAAIESVRLEPAERPEEATT